MKIAGIQKLTLIDYPGKIACTLFLYGCNFRCGFCHNPELVVKKNENVLTEEYVLDFLEKRKKYLEGVCITGGEPLLNADENFLNFLKEIKKRGYSIKIDTNGSFPEKLRKIIEEGLVDYIAMDIKSSREKYREIADTEVDLNKIEESIKLISKSKDYEFRTTIVEEVHDTEEMKKIAGWINELIGKPKKFVLQGFKNNKKFINPDFVYRTDTSEKTLDKIREEIKNCFLETEIRV